MEILKRYLYEIGRQLPLKQRDDILKELESSLMDTFESEKKYCEKTESNECKFFESDEDIMIGIIKDFGCPKCVASKYTTNNYLIGPRYFETYKLVLRIVLTVMIIITTVSFCMGFFLAESTNSLIEPFSNLIAGLLSGIVSSIGMVTIIFYLIDRNVPDSFDPNKERDFDPRKLPPVPTSREKIKYSDIIIDIVACIVFLFLLNIQPDKLNIYFMQDNIKSWSAIPLFNPASLAFYLPFWNVLLVSSLINKVVILLKGRNTFASDLVHIILSIASVIALGALIYDKNLLGFTQANFSESLKALYPLVLTGIKASVAVVMTVIVVFTGVRVFRLVKR